MASPIEELFQEIFGYLPTKPGAAYERLAAIAMQLLDDGEARHDARMRGKFSETLYQLDVLCRDQNGQATMAEAKDYSSSGEKVGRADIQKLGGALPDLEDIRAGAFFSATGYTTPATKYANAASQITGGKGIRLYELAASTEEDEKDFLRSIVLNLHIAAPDLSRAKFTAAFTTEGYEVLSAAVLGEGEESKAISYQLRELYTASGDVGESLESITKHGYGDIDEATSCVHACFWLPDRWIRAEGVLAGIKGIEYTIPFSRLHRRIEISDDSERRLVLRDENGSPLRVLTDRKLREFSFDEQGNVVRV